MLEEVRVINPNGDEIATWSTEDMADMGIKAHAEKLDYVLLINYPNSRVAKLYYKAGGIRVFERDLMSSWYYEIDER